MNSADHPKTQPGNMIANLNKSVSTTICSSVSNIKTKANYLVIWCSFKAFVNCLIPSTVFWLMLESSPIKTQFSRCSNTWNSIPSVEAFVDIWGWKFKISLINWVTGMMDFRIHRLAGVQGFGTVYYRFRGLSSLSTIMHTWSTNPLNHFSTTFTFSQVPFQATDGKHWKASPLKYNNEVLTLYNKHKEILTIMMILTKTHNMKLWWRGIWRQPCLRIKL